MAIGNFLQISMGIEMLGNNIRKNDIAFRGGVNAITI